MAKTNIFRKATLYTASTANSMIKGTEYLGSQIFMNIHSKKNTEVNPLTGEISTKLSYKVGTGIATSQKEDGNVYLCEKNGKEYLLGIFCGGSANKIDVFSLPLDTISSGEAIAINPNSHYLVQMMIVRDRYLNYGDEIDEYFRRVDFNTEEKVIGIDQKNEFIILADSIKCDMVSQLDKKVFETEDFFYPSDYLIELATGVKKDLTAYLKNGYNENKMFFKDVVLEEMRRMDSIDVESVAGVDKIMSAVEKAPVEIPKTLEVKQKKKKTPKNRLKELKEKYWDGVETFTQEQIKEMPLLLQNGYLLAKQSFESNRKFFGKQEWELVEAIFCGDVRSINFTGPAGVGKTTTIRSIAGALGMPFVLVGGSANIEESDLLGNRGVDAVDGVSVTTWNDGPITSAIRYGAFLLFDEVNSAEPGILMKLNTILDGSKSLILSTAEEVRVHPKFVYSEAMNVGAGYAGTDLMNQSHLDRIDEMFKITSKSVDDEAEIIAEVTGYDNLENIKKMCHIKKHILQLIESDGDSSEQSCSPRRLIAWVKKARRTGEFIESSLTTVIAHLSIYEEDFDTLEVRDILHSSGIASEVMQEIINLFEDVEY